MSKDRTPNSKITLDQLLDEIERLRQSQPGGASVRDIARATGKSPFWVRVHLRELAEQDRLRVRTSVTRSLDGRLMPCPTYEIKDAAENKGEKI